MTQAFAEISNAQAVPLNRIPLVPIQDFRKNVLGLVSDRHRIISFFGKPQGRAVRLYILLADDRAGKIGIMSTEVEHSYLSLTPDCLQAHWFEREIAEQWGIDPQGHPWLKPIRFHNSYRPQDDSTLKKEIMPGVTAFYQMHGEEIHDVAVGPVHAGVIEPGHFRFQCHGERVYHLEIFLGYQHRGIERALIGGVDIKTVHYMETLAGDTSIGHATAYCQAVEALMGANVPLRAHALRGLMLELERLANHIGDLGALANDVGYLPTASYCGRIRGDILNMSALVCGSRFGRNMLEPGGVAFDLDQGMKTELQQRLKSALRHTAGAVNLLWETPCVVERFENTGVVNLQTAQNIGLVGLSARASGLDLDTRFNFPYGIYCFSQIPVSTFPSGDVFARAYVRWLEIQRSMEFLEDQLKSLPEGQICDKASCLAPDALAVSLTEGWRGEICHTVMTDDQGKISHYKITDPSFHNWMGLAMALRDEEISNFPLCNKSFNLSYCGHDL